MAKFEECLQRLEKIVQELEKGDVPLEKSLTLFEEGMHLSSTCRKELEQAEGKVEILLKKNGKLQAEPFEPLAEKAPAQSVGCDRREAPEYVMSVEWRFRTLPRSPSPLLLTVVSQEDLWALVWSFLKAIPGSRSLWPAGFLLTSILCT